VLQVFVQLNGGTEPVRVSVPPSGQQFVAASGPGHGRKVHFWWPVDRLAAEDKGAESVLRLLAPNLDRVWVGRDLAGAQLQPVFSGPVVECGFDGQIISLTAMEPVQARASGEGPYPPAGGVREPVQPIAPVPPPAAVQQPVPPAPVQPQPQVPPVAASQVPEAGAGLTRVTGGVLTGVREMQPQAS
jgi:hypothetical protein